MAFFIKIFDLRFKFDAFVFRNTIFKLQNYNVLFHHQGKVKKGNFSLPIERKNKFFIFKCKLSIAYFLIGWLLSFI